MESSVKFYRLTLLPFCQQSEINCEMEVPSLVPDDTFSSDRFRHCGIRISSDAVLVGADASIKMFVASQS